MIQQIHSMLGIWKREETMFELGFREWQRSKETEMGEGTSRIPEPAEFAIHTQRCLLTSETTDLLQRNSSWTIRCTEYVGFPVSFPYFMLYCGTCDRAPGLGNTCFDPYGLRFSLGSSSWTSSARHRQRWLSGLVKAPPPSAFGHFLLEPRSLCHGTWWSDWSQFWLIKAKSLCN